MRNEHAQGYRGTATPDQAQMYTWTFPGAPIRINIQLSVVLKLQAEASQDVGHNRMVGGILLGPSRPPGSVEINDCVFLPSASPSSQRYALNVSELERLRQERGNSRNGRGPLSVVGYFRAQQEHGLALRDDEIELVQRHFHDPSQVVLLIQVSPEQCTAGFLFWDGDNVVPFSLLDFPLDAAALQLEGAARSFDPSVEPAVEPVEHRPAPEAEIGLDPRPAAVAPRRGWPSRSHTAIGAAILAAMLLVVGLIALTLRKPGSAPSKTSSSTAPSVEFSLQLQVEVQGSGLNLRWNPQVAQIAQANAGRLVVTEGDRQERVVELDAEQLKSGHVYYQASADQVRFRLEVSNVFGLATKESVLVLLSGTTVGTPAVPGKSTETQAAPKVLKTVRIDDPPPGPLAAGNDVRPLTTPAAAQGVESRTVPSKSEPLTPAPIPPNRVQDSGISPTVSRSLNENKAEQAKAPDTQGAARVARSLPSNPVSPPVSIDSFGAPVTGPTVILPSATEAPPLARPAANPAPSTQSSLPVPSIARTDSIPSPTAPSPAALPPPAPSQSNFAAPVPIKQVSPLITPNVRAEVNSGEGKLVVSVRVAIDESGKVKSAQIVPSSLPAGNPKIYVTAAALGAARVWQFRPATLNGTTILSDYIIEFKFR